MPEKAARRQRAGGTKQAATPRVGIVYLVGDKLWIDATPLAGAGRYAGFAIHEGDHITYWAQLVKQGAVPNTEYERFPRGRVAHDTKTDQFTLLADECILRKKAVVRAILRQMHLPLKGTTIGPDSHYRCFHCLGRSR